MSENAPGHSDNVANLGVLTSKVESFGSRYNPNNPILLIDNLHELKSKGEMVIDAFILAEIHVDNAQSALRALFNDFEPSVTRVSNFLNVCGASSEMVNKGQSIIRELRGKRASDLLTAEEIETEREKGNDVKQVTRHNSTTESRIRNLGILTQFLSIVPEYSPNEEDLTVAALASKLANIKAKNASLVTAETVLETARSNRKAVLYSTETGLVNVALSVKQYVKAVFGANSDQYNQVKGIRFSNKN